MWSAVKILIALLRYLLMMASKRRLGTVNPGCTFRVRPFPTEVLSSKALVHAATKRLSSKRSSSLLAQTATITSFVLFQPQLHRALSTPFKIPPSIYAILFTLPFSKIATLQSLTTPTNANSRPSPHLTSLNIGGSQALSELVLRLQSNHMLLDHLTDAAHFTNDMSSRDFFNTSPTVVMPASAPDQYFGNHYMEQDTRGSMSNGISPAFNGFQNQQVMDVATPSGQTTPSLAGRKRSRGDIFSEVEEDAGRDDDGNITSIPANGVNGDQMVVESSAEQGPFGTNHVKRPSVTSRKSQRMDSKASLPGSDDLAQLVLPHSIREATTEPLIDEATRSLGISWQRMDATEALQINQRAYSKWIQNHYPRLTEVAIWLENSALPAYLVTANNVNTGQREYYIFSNDLTEARLVTTDPTQLIPRLRMLPALELAAPGGKLLAETDPITASQNEIDDTFVDIVGCAAHAMEMD